jgi:hypothetical protein
MAQARLPAEEKWYALTGRVVDAKVEADGDIHLALVDANGNSLGTVSAEIPVGPKWCEIRQMVFGWTKQKFPFTVKSVHDVTIAEHVVTVTGKAFYDIAHAPADHSIIADNLSKAGFSWGCVSAADSHGRTVWVVDAHGCGKRFIVRMKS